MENRTTIGLKITTKNKLDANRVPGQCYDGFVCQLIDLWEKTDGKISSAGENQDAGEKHHLVA